MLADISSTDSALRWETDADDYAVPHARTRIIGAMLGQYGCESVADIGCARGALREVLPEGTAYHGIDFINAFDPREGDRFTAVDLNGRELPPTAIDEEWVVLSGVLEYVRDLPRLLKWIRASLVRPNARILLSYTNETHVSLRWRRVRGQEVAGHPDWVPLLSRGTLFARLEQNGYEVTEAFDLERDYRRNRSLHKLPDYLPPVYRADWRSSLFGHQWIIVAETSAAPPLAHRL